MPSAAGPPAPLGTMATVAPRVVASVEGTSSTCVGADDVLAASAPTEDADASASRPTPPFAMRPQRINEYGPDASQSRRFFSMRLFTAEADQRNGAEGRIVHTLRALLHVDTAVPHRAQRRGVHVETHPIVVGAIAGLAERLGPRRPLVGWCNLPAVHVG